MVIIVIQIFGYGNFFLQLLEWDGLTPNKSLPQKSGRHLLDAFLVPVSLATQLQGSFCRASYITGKFSISNPWVTKWYKFLGAEEGKELRGAAVIGDKFATGFFPSQYHSTWLNPWPDRTEFQQIQVIRD